MYIYIIFNIHSYIELERNKMTETWNLIVSFRFGAKHLPNAVNMDSHVGLDYIVDNPDYCAKLATGKIIQRSR